MHAGRQAGRRAGSKAGRKASRKEGMIEGMQAGRKKAMQGGKQACMQGGRHAWRKERRHARRSTATDPCFVLCSYGTRTRTRNSSRARGTVRYDCTSTALLQITDRTYEYEYCTDVRVSKLSYCTGLFPNERTDGRHIYNHS